MCFFVVLFLLFYCKRLRKLYHIYVKTGTSSAMFYFLINVGLYKDHHYGVLHQSWLTTLQALDEAKHGIKQYENWAHQYFLSCNLRKSIDFQVTFIAVAIVTTSE